MTLHELEDAANTVAWFAVLAWLAMLAYLGWVLA